jgi:uncharacterized protein
MYGASRYETGSNLPTHQCSGWDFCERVELTKRGMVGFSVDQATVEREVRQNGWCVWDDSPRESQRAADIKPASRGQRRPPIEPENVATDFVPSATPTAPSAAPVVPPATPIVLPATPKAAPVRQVVASAPEKGAARTGVISNARHQVVWFDIPVRDIDRALRFYSAVLGTELKKEQAGPGVSMAMLPSADGFVGGCLLQNADAKPSDCGPLLYLNTHGRLDEAVNAVEKNGGSVLSAKHSIAPFGFRAIVLDSEGNRVALHSQS